MTVITSDEFKSPKVNLRIEGKEEAPVVSVLDREAGGLTAERLAGLAAYCLIEEPTAEDVAALTEAYYDAVGYLEGAGVSAPREGTLRRAQYDSCVNYMVLDSYDTRMGTLTSGTAVENPAFRRKLNQLKLTEYFASNLGTGEEGGR